MMDSRQRMGRLGRGMLARACGHWRAGGSGRYILVEDGIFVDCTGAVFVVWPFDTVPPCSVSVLYGEPRGGVIG